MISKKAIALCATVGVALTGFAIATPASAEPVSNSYAIVGSDTLEDVVSALANGTLITTSSVRSTTAAGSTVGSFDATGSPYITTKPAGVRFGRPNGSGDGVKALSRSIDGSVYTSGTAGGPAGVVVKDAVDIARSSSAGTQNGAGELEYIPFGRDAIAYAYDSRSDAAVLTSLSTLNAATMASLYNCTVRQLDGVTITPIIPQAGSGTRKDFLKKIGIDPSGNGALTTTTTLGGCVEERQEHDGTALIPNSFMPMSASRWIAMNTGASYDKRGFGILSSATGVAPVLGTGTAMTPNPAFYADTTWGRDTFLVVEFARVDSTNAKYDPALVALLDPTIANSLSNTSTSLLSKSGTVKKKFGLLAPASSTPFRVLKTA